MTVSGCLSLGQQRIRLEADWHWLYWKLPAASHRSHTFSPCTTKTLPYKRNTGVIKVLFISR